VARRGQARARLDRLRVAPGYDPSVDRDPSEPSTKLQDTERRRLAALVSADRGACEALHAADYELITPGGVTYSRAEYLSEILDGTLRYRRFEPAGEMRVRMLGVGAAAIRYQVDIEIEWAGGGDSARVWHTDLYELIDGRWQAVWSHATETKSD
jgi:uncharacterized protein DUF4440